MKDLKSLTDLGIDKKFFNINASINYQDFFIAFFVKGVSKDTLGFEYNLSKDPKYNKKSYFFNELVKKEKIKIKFISDDEQLLALENDVLYLPKDITIIDFYRTIRNSIAHHNYFAYESNILFFSAFAGKSENASIDRSWKTRSKFYYLLSDSNYILRIVEFLYEFFNINS